MKKLVLLAVMMLIGIPVVNAAPVVQDPKGTFYKIKAAVDTLDPQAEWIYSLRKGEFYNAYTVALLDFKKEDSTYASLRAGYSVDKSVLGEIGVDIKNLYTTFVPENVKKVAVLGQALDITSRYLTIGYAFGYSWDVGGKFLHGPSVGVKASWKF